MSKDTEQFLRLVNSAKGGDDRAFDKILSELEPELKKISKRYFISGSDPQDVLQEGRIGVWKAVMDFDDSKDMSFKNFALNLCVKRHVITAVAAANRKPLCGQVKTTQNNHCLILLPTRKCHSLTD